MRRIRLKLSYLLATITALSLLTTWLSLRHVTVATDSNSIPLQRRTPRFFLHIGPHKSATTYLQCALYRNAASLQAHDRIVYLGKVDAAYCGFKVKQQDSRISKLDQCQADPDCWEGLVRQWDEYRRKGIDLILSKEALSDWTSSRHSEADFRQQFWSTLAKALQDWDVTVILTYRHYHQWLPSAFHQYRYEQIQRGQWPQGELKPFPEQLKSIIHDRTPAPYPFLDEILDFSFPTGWNLQILNIHQQDILPLVLCEVLHAAHTCKHFESISPKRISQSERILADSLNVQAMQWGWTTSPGRRFRRMRATHRVLQTSQDLPMVCPSDMLIQGLKQRSKSLQEKFMPSSSDWSFDSSSLCVVNASAVLLQGEQMWREHYRTLK